MIKMMIRRRTMWERKELKEKAKKVVHSAYKRDAQKISKKINL